MAILVTKTTAEFPWIDQTTYDATITGIKQVEGPKGPYLTWMFKIVDPTQNGEPLESEISVIGSTSLKLSDKSNLGLWLTAAGFNIDIGDTIDVEDVVGREVQVGITIVEKGGTKKSYVNNVYPRKKKVAKPSAQPSAQAPKLSVVKDPVKKAAPAPAPKEEAVASVEEAAPADDNALFDWGDDDA